MKNKKKNKKTTTSNKVKRLNSNYINYNGNTYEKMSSNCEDIEIELHVDVLKKLNALVDDGRFVSIGDAVRHILRMKIESLNDEA